MRKRKVLIVDDEKLLRWSLSQKMQEWNFDVSEAENGNEALFTAEEEAPDLIMLDVKLPDRKGTDLLKEIKEKNPEVPVIMMTAYGVIDDAVIAMRRGAYDFITKPIDDSKLKNTINNAIETASLKKEVAYYREREKKQFDPSQFIAHSKAMMQVFEMVKKIAESEASIILLQGESGTGKDLLAQTIHHLSRRNQSAYLAINCSAIPENLLESELFGYEKGAFTDAKQTSRWISELSQRRIKISR
jgi:two-component system response regulator AtoC